MTLALALRPDADGYVDLGLLLQGRGEPARAQAAFDRALQLAPDAHRAAAIRRRLQP